MADPGTKTETLQAPDTRIRHEPIWYVVLWDDNDHTYRYVIEMLVKLFRMTPAVALKHACEVDTEGVTILARLPKSQAAEKRDQVLRFGGDPQLKTSHSMWATIEPADD
jgi:ATP-dependent Clp protease adaptor protein ClpS